MGFLKGFQSSNFYLDELIRRLGLLVAFYDLFVNTDSSEWLFWYKKVIYHCGDIMFS